MLIRNAYIEKSTVPEDIRITDGKFAEIGKGLQPALGEEVIDCGGKLVLPPLIESHMHLDTCLTAGEPRWNKSGTLFEGIEIWSERKKSLTKADVRERVNRAVRMQAANGIQYVRTHVDITDPSLVALEAMCELREELKDFVEIQIVAFPQEGILSYPNGKELMENAVKAGADAVGAIPHYEFTREYAVESLHFAVKLAEKYGKLIDVHCDEIDDPASRGLEVLACLAYETGMKEMVSASHTCALGSYDNSYAFKLFRLLRLSGINFVCNPHINIMLQGRLDAYPRRRGLTRVKELLENGNNVSFGYDVIYDPWYLLGTGNMLDVVHIGLHVCQMGGYDDIADSYKLVTFNAAKALHLGDAYGIKPGNPANLILFDAKDFYEALNERAVVLKSWKNGKLIASSTPAKKETHF
ncbi:MAG: cytosine deaminase [Clostridiales Family XIII bacterium]|nr:cytosine deaminase [Clostridiales Family XIII bacterium]